MTLGDKLMFLRKQKGLSQLEVSEKLDVSRQAVSRWESGISKPSVENLQSLCQLYDVTIDNLLNESEERSHTISKQKLNLDCDVDRSIKMKRKLPLGRLIIGIVILVLVSLCIWGYKHSQNEQEINLHDLPGEEVVPEQGSTFILNID